MSYGAKQLFLTQFSSNNVYSFSSEFDELGMNDVLALGVRQVSVQPAATEFRAIHVSVRETQPLPGIMGMSVGVISCSGQTCNSPF